MAITYNDTTNSQGLIQHIEFLTGQANLDTGDLARLVNFGLDKYSHIAITGDGRWKFDDTTNTDFPRATANLTSGQQDYELETGYLIIERVEVKNEEGDWRKLTAIDQRDVSGALDEFHETDGDPMYYDVEGSSILLYPAPDYTQATSLKVYFKRPAVHFDKTDTTSAIGIPSVHAEYLALHAAYNIALKLNLKNRNQLREEMVAFEQMIREFFAMRDDDKPLQIRGRMNVIT